MLHGGADIFQFLLALDGAVFHARLHQLQLVVYRFLQLGLAQGQLLAQFFQAGVLPFRHLLLRGRLQFAGGLQGLVDHAADLFAQVAHPVAHLRAQVLQLLLHLAFQGGHVRRRGALARAHQQAQQGQHGGQGRQNKGHDL